MPVVRVRIGTFHYPLLLPEVASGALVTTLLWGLLDDPADVGNLSAALSQHHLSGLEIAQLEFHQ